MVEKRSVCSGVKENWLDPSPRCVVRECVLGVRLGQDGVVESWLENSWYPGMLETSGYFDGCGWPLGRSQKFVGVAVPFGYVGCLGFCGEYGVEIDGEFVEQHDTRLENSVRSSGSRLCCLA